nr:immunoglobulin light chain junction region [Macaca mulatta]MOW58753.1 immunoglobulin light chain junction region [Macaca mulatta]MOW60450.1 immunoglobulin light chain junction region [Macaca mulatta]MOW61494.1 immunoglobulin light chain junction region [Macaca mulatta]
DYYCGTWDGSLSAVLF